MLAIYHLNYQVESYEEWFALGLLMPRQMMRQMAMLMEGVQAGSGSGRVPKAWIKALVDSDCKADEVAFAINAERLARRIWGRKNR